MKTFDEQFNDILIEKFLMNENDIKDDYIFLVELEFDLEDIACFIREVEYKFQVDISKHDLKHFLTVGEAKKCIKRKLYIYNYLILN